LIDFVRTNSVVGNLEEQRIYVRDFLGHANITTTSAYLVSSPMRLARAMAKLDAESEAPAAAEPEKDSHTVRTNDARDTQGPTEGRAVTH
jgi:hypothetical protein